VPRNPGLDDATALRLERLTPFPAAGIWTCGTQTHHFIAGCNGAGKTAFAKEFLPKKVKCLRFGSAT